MNITKRILIAEDEETERTALREIFKAEPGWEITETKDGQEAIDKLCDGFRPDVCMLDLRMPRMDGLQMLQRMRHDPLLRDIKVIITSANRDKDMIVALAKLKISGYLLKPYNAAKTLATLRPVVESVVANPALFSKNLLCRTALVADDNATERTAIKEIFKTQADWELVLANDGQDALDRLHGGLRPDLIIVDLRMPRMDGFTLIQRIREDVSLRSLRVVVVSGDQDRDQVRALAQLNISGYLLKPLNETKVKNALRQATGESVSAEKPPEAKPRTGSSAPLPPSTPAAAPPAPSTEIPVVAAPPEIPASANTPAG